MFILGLEKSDLDRLETIWWRSKGWKYQQPNIVMQFGSEKNIFEQSRDEAFDEICVQKISHVISNK